MKTERILICLGIFIFVASFVIAYNHIFFCESNCKESYSGICLDEDSIYFGCNMDSDVCDKNDFEIATTIKFMENEKLSIYGSSSCGYCTKQLNEFGNFQNYLKENGFYFDCKDKSNLKVCSDIKYTPTWKKNGEIITSGYIPLENIQESFS